MELTTKSLHVHCAVSSCVHIAHYNLTQNLKFFVDHNASLHNFLSIIFQKFDPMNHKKTSFIIRSYLNIRLTAFPRIQATLKSKINRYTRRITRPSNRIALKFSTIYYQCGIANGRPYFKKLGAGYIRENTVSTVCLLPGHFKKPKIS